MSTAVSNVNNEFEAKLYSVMLLKLGCIIVLYNNDYVLVISVFYVLFPKVLDHTIFYR